MATKTNKHKFRLKGHEKFILREGWFSKGLIAVHDECEELKENKEDNEDVYTKLFLREDSTDILGVGSNMVKSIRYWLKAFNVIEEKIGVGCKLTDLGEIIYENDPYIQQYFTLWLLHSNLLKNIEMATSFSIFFNKCDIDEFTKEDVNVLMNNEMKKYIQTSFSESSLKDDIDVILAMYSREKEENYDPEDKNVSPFSTLGILSKVGNKYYRKKVDFNIFDEWVVLYEIACLFDEDKKRKQIGINDLLEKDNNIGKIYNLSRIEVNNYLDILEKKKYINVIRTAGLDVIEQTKQFDVYSVINEYYKKHEEI